MEPFIGQIQAFGFNFAPQGWAKCDGQLLPISSNTALFSLLGTTYGGDGRTTFGLPDLRGRSIVHAGNGPGLSNINLGQKSGEEQVTLSINNMLAHNHTVAVSNEDGEESDPTNRVIAANAASFNDDASGATLKNNSVSTVGGSQAFGIRSPFIGINVCIALVGIYPSRS